MPKWASARVSGTKERARSLHASAVLILGSGTGQSPVRLDEAFTTVAGRPYMPRNSLIQESLVLRFGTEPALANWLASS